MTMSRRVVRDHLGRPLRMSDIDGHRDYGLAYLHQYRKRSTPEFVGIGEERRLGASHHSTITICRLARVMSSDYVVVPNYCQVGYSVDLKFSTSITS